MYIVRLNCFTFSPSQKLETPLKLPNLPPLTPDLGQQL